MRNAAWFVMVFNNVRDHANVTDSFLVGEAAAAVIIRGDRCVVIPAFLTSAEDRLIEIEHR